ncbi:glycosyl transferase family 90-domain-containing protein [Mycena pura]|uniref:Glycosyl transferase family 90-domain-containing protein n=1 Tax=Mycena pura TaxID=153505 RepID=A0AAD6YU61_9AGAR|nr:glycosyl transferase family 90-domain-containing protein [Mycena pura]
MECVHRRPKRCLPFDELEDSALPLLHVSRSHSPPHERRPTTAVDLLCQQSRPYWRLLLCVGIAAATFGVLVGTFALAPFVRASTISADDAFLASRAVDELYARQSKTLAQAAARYTLRTGRRPPARYDRWFDFAREKGCLIDEYDRIHRDFKVWYQLAVHAPTHFREMIARATRKLDGVAAEISRVEVLDGTVSITGSTAYDYYWQSTISRFSQHLPDMTVLMNGRDEPRVAFNYRARSAQEVALAPNDSTPFMHEPRPTIDFFTQQSGCDVPAQATGFMKSVNGDSAFLLATAKPGFTTDLYPILSMSKISPCFADILFPTEYYYDQSWWAPHFSYPDNIPWEAKKDLAYWRGMSNGGMIIGSNYHHFARFRLMDISRARPDLIDAKITLFAETLCAEGCDRAAVVAEYNITGSGEAREELYRYKYAIDVDGTTFSGRFLGLLRSGSLVLKSTVFEEYFNDWLRPFEHFVPILPDLSDLAEKIQWANAHPDEARLIQQRGLEVARRVITDNQNDCYFFAVLVEWAQLLEYAKIVWVIERTRGVRRTRGLNPA